MLGANYSMYVRSSWILTQEMSKILKTFGQDYV